MAIFTAFGAFLAGISGGLFTAAAATQFVVGTIANIAVSFIIKALAGPQAQPAFGIQGKLQAGESVPRQFPLGIGMTAGSLAYANEWGSGNAYFTQVIALSDLPVKGLLAVMVDGVYVTLDTGSPHADYGYPVTEYRGTTSGDHLWIKFYDGTQSAADSFLTGTVSSTARPYESTRVGVGCAYAICTAKANQSLFPGFPAFRFLLDSVKLYDASKDTTAGGSGSQRWDTPSTWGGDGDYLPVVQAYNLLRGISWDGEWLYGMQGVGGGRLPSAAWIAEIGTCRATVTAVGGGTEARYRAGGMLSVDTECGAAIEAIMAACAGRIGEDGGTFKPVAGAVGSAVATISDADLITTEEQVFSPFKRLDDRVNAIDVQYPEPDEGFALKPVPSRYDSALEAADGGRRLVRPLVLHNVPYAGQAQRLQKAALKEARRDRRHRFTLSPAFQGLETNDRIDIDSDRHGYSAKAFRVDAVLDRPDALVTVECSELDPTDYDPPSYATATKRLAKATAADPDVAGVTDSELADMPEARFKMRATGAGAGKPINGTASQAKAALGITSSDVSGLGALATKSSVGTTDLDANAVTYAKMQQVVQNRFVGRVTAGTGDLETLTRADALTILALGALAMLNSVDTAEITNAAVTGPKIADGVVNNAKLENMGANTVKVNATGSAAAPTNLAVGASQLLGRGSSGNIAPITLGPNLSMTGTTLDATGGGGGGSPILSWMI